MPNQYTKYKAALENAQPYEFRWKKCSGQKPRKQKSGKSKTLSLRDQQSEPHERPIIIPHSVLLYTPSSGLRIDPFRSYPVNPNQAELSVLDHFLNHLTPSASQNVTIPGKPKSHETDPHVKYLLPFVMHEAPLFDALLATSRSQMMLSAGLSAYNDEFFVFHRGRAISGLRRQLQNNTDTSAMLAVTMLITCDYLTGDLEAVAGHAKALERMLQLRGRMPQETAWDRFVERGVQVYKTITVVLAGTKVGEDLPKCKLDALVDPLISLDYPQPPFASELCQRWAKLPKGFCDLILTSTISTQLIMIITAVNDIDPGVGTQLNETLKTTAPIQAALQRFLQHKDATILERIAASGLLIYTFQYPRIVTPNLFHDPPMRSMTNLLRNPNGIQAGPERDLLLWTHVVVEGFASHRSARLPGTRDLYQKALRKHFIMQDWPRLETLLERFFQTPELLRRWENCHSNCLKARPEHRAASNSSSPSLFTNESRSSSEQPPACPFAGGKYPDSGAKCPFSQITTAEV